MFRTNQLTNQRMAENVPLRNAWSPDGPLISTIFVILVGIAVLRPLIGETYSSGADPFAEALPEISDPTSTRTLIFDLIILTCASSWLLVRATAPTLRHRRTGLGLGIALLAAASAISCAYAGNRRIAINAAIDWLCLPIAAITLVQVMRSRWQLRVLLAGILASAAVQSAQCIEEYATFDDTWAHYQSIKNEFWAAQGVDLDSGQVELFEDRIKAGEAAGFFAHSNVAGSYLSMCAIIGLGVIGHCRRRILATRASPADGRSPATDIALALGVTLLTAVMLAAVFLTGSRGAMLSGLAGLALWLLIWGAHAWVRRRPRAAFAALWLMVLSGAGASVLYGTWKDGLPGASLSFRWQYWTASAEMIADRPWTGVGRENFGRHYLQYKDIEAPEEIANPHNVLVQAAAETGLIGLAGMAALLVGGSYYVAGLFGLRRRDALGDYARLGADDVPAYCMWLAGAVLLGCVTIGRIPFLGTADPNLLFYSTVVTAIAWSASFLLFGHAMGLAENALRRMATAVGIGLFTFLLHDMINFAMFMPGAAYTFFACTALAIAARQQGEGEQPAAPVRARWLPFAAAASCTTVFAVMVVLPVWRANGHIRAGRALAAIGQVEQAFQRFSNAAAADPLDPTPHVEQARLHASIAESVGTQAAFEHAYDAADNALNRAIQRDAFDVSLLRMRRELLSRKAERLGRPADFEAAVPGAEAVLELYPRSPQDIVALGDAHLAAGLHAEVGANRAEHLRQAVETYVRAVNLDAQRPQWERHRRFRQTELEEIRTKIEQARIASTPAN